MKQTQKHTVMTSREESNLPPAPHFYDLPKGTVVARCINPRNVVTYTVGDTFLDAGRPWVSLTNGSNGRDSMALADAAATGLIWDVVSVPTQEE